MKLWRKILTNTSINMDGLIILAANKTSKLNKEKEVQGTTITKNRFGISADGNNMNPTNIHKSDKKIVFH